jgi:hypothetical protein
MREAAKRIWISAIFLAVALAMGSTSDRQVLLGPALAANGQDHRMGHGQAAAQGTPTGPGTTDDGGLGALYAAHASAAAFANAAPSSEVGRIRTYGAALNQYLDDLSAGASPSTLNADIVTVGDALGVAANQRVTLSTLNRLDSLLGLSTASDPNWEAATGPRILRIANAKRR